MWPQGSEKSKKYQNQTKKKKENKRNKKRKLNWLVQYTGSFVIHTEVTQQFSVD